MTTKNKSTFAERARKIQNKYKRASFDKIEQADMERELEALVQEQEQVRQQMGLDNPDVMACGGKMYPFGGWNQNVADTIINNSGFAQGTVPEDVQLESYIAKNNPTGLETDKLQNWGANQELKASKMPGNPTWWGENKQYLPSAISGLSNIGSNLLLASMAKSGMKGLDTRSPMVTPSKMNLTPVAEQLRKDATTTKNINLRNARNTGANAGTTIANMGAVNAAVDRGLGANLANLYGQQEQFNTGAENQFALANAQMSEQDNRFNQQLQYQALQDRLGYLSGALGTIPGVMQDINLMNADDKTRAMYENYLRTLGKNYQYTGSLFGPQLGYQVRG